MSKKDEVKNEVKETAVVRPAQLADLTKPDMELMNRIDNGEPDIMSLIPDESQIVVELGKVPVKPSKTEWVDGLFICLRPVQGQDGSEFFVMDFAQTVRDDKGNPVSLRPATLTAGFQIQQFLQERMYRSGDWFGLRLRDKIPVGSGNRQMNVYDFKSHKPKWHEIKGAELPF